MRRRHPIDARDLFARRALAASLADPAGEAPDVDPDAAALRDADAGATSFCGRCSFFVEPATLGAAGSCRLVTGPVEPADVCDLFVDVVAVEAELPEPLPLISSADREFGPEAWAEGTGVIADETPDALPETSVLVVAREGEVTADRRLVEPGALSWREPPLTLTVNHDADQRAGRIEAFGRTDRGGVDLLRAIVTAGNDVTRDDFDAHLDAVGEYVVGFARHDLESEFGRDTAREVARGQLLGVSMEVGDEVVEFACTETDDDGYCVTDLMVLLEGRIGAVTLTPFQAIESAEVLSEHRAGAGDRPGAVSIDDVVVEVEAADDDVALEIMLAAAGPMRPPAEWFADPGLESLTPMTITDDGRIFGHVAGWGSCHIGRQGCTTPPASSTSYAYFLKPGAVLCADGSTVAAGTLTLGTGHAPTARGVTAAQAAAHYDNTGTVFADVAVGEDAHGPWYSGALRPDVDELQERRLRAAHVSGDWRPTDDGLELIRVLAVNSPGFPTHNRAVVASGERTALIAGVAPRVEAGCGCSDHDADPVVLARLDDVESALRRMVATVDALELPAAAVEALAAAVHRS